MTERICIDCQNSFVQTDVQREVQQHVGADACYKCWVNRLGELPDVKAKIAEEKAAFDAKPIREIAMTLLDDIDSTQDECHPSSLNGYRSCLRAMEQRAQRGCDLFNEASEPFDGPLKKLHTLLRAIQMLAHAYAEHEDLEQRKKAANVIEELTRVRWIIPQIPQ